MGDLVSFRIPIIARRHHKDGIYGRVAIHTLADDLVQSESKFFFVACVHHVVTTFLGVPDFMELLTQAGSPGHTISDDSSFHIVGCRSLAWFLDGSVVVWWSCLYDVLRTS